jgi:hypothetical protein
MASLELVMSLNEFSYMKINTSHFYNYMDSLEGGNYKDKEEVARLGKVLHSLEIISNQENEN